jgi:hypothetical protein
MRISVMREEAPDADRLVGGCPVRLRVEKGRWIAKIEDPAVCEPTIEKFAELGPEAKRNLARHLTTDDPQQDAELAKMRRRAT